VVAPSLGLFATSNQWWGTRSRSFPPSSKACHLSPGAANCYNWHTPDRNSVIHLQADFISIAPPLPNAIGPVPVPRPGRHFRVWTTQARKHCLRLLQERYASLALAVTRS